MGAGCWGWGDAFGMSWEGGVGVGKLEVMYAFYGRYRLDGNLINYCESQVGCLDYFVTQQSTPCSRGKDRKSFSGV